MDPEAVKTLQEEWEAARDDAGFAEDQVRLYVFPGAVSEDGNLAYHWTPGQEVHRDPYFPDDKGGQLADANKHRDSHRISAWVDVSKEVLGAKLRHELEQARQVEAHENQIFDLNDLVKAVLAQKLEGLRGGGQLYNAIPLEVDANAASARFAANRYGEEVARELADAENEAGVKEGVLFRSLTPPAPIESLPERTLACSGFAGQEDGLRTLYSRIGFSTLTSSA